MAKRSAVGHSLERQTVHGQGVTGVGPHRAALECGEVAVDRLVSLV